MDYGRQLSTVTTVFDSFHGRLIVARLATEGIRADLSGSSDGPYPFQSTIDVLVAKNDVERAKEILMGDAVDAMLGVSDEDTTLRSRAKKTQRRFVARRDSCR